MSRILIHDPRPASDDWRALHVGEGYDVEKCEDRETLIGSFAHRRPDMLIYVIGDFEVDLAVLTVVRRAAPRLPLILLGGVADLEVRRRVQQLQPIYYGVFPLETFELSDVVRGALAQHPGRSQAS